MRIPLALMVAVLTGCPSPDPTPADPDAAAPTADAATILEPVTATFQRVGQQGSAFFGHVLGPGGALYAMRDAGVAVSTDRGLTWTVTALPDVVRLAATPTALFGFRSSTFAPGPAVLRSTDAGVTWSPVPLLHPVPQAGGAFLATTGTALWILMSSTQPQLFPANLARSVDDGASFTDIALPGTFTQVLLTSGRDGKAYVVGDGHAFRSADGASWEDLGAFAEVMYVLAAPGGTAFLMAREAGQFVLYRRTAGATAWTADAPLTTMPQLRVRPNGNLVRVWFDGTVDVSTTDGVTWTPQVTTPSGVMTADMVALDEVVIAFAARLEAAATAWTITPPTHVPSDVDPRDISFTATGTAILGGRSRLYVSRDQGQTWRGGDLQLGLGDVISVLSVTPDGARVFVGSTLGRYAMLTGDGDAEIRPMQAFAEQTEHVRAVQWISNDTLLLTTSLDDSSGGDLWEIHPDKISGFRKQYPYGTISDPSGHPTAGFWGVGECPNGPTWGPARLSSRRLIGPSNYLDKLFSQSTYATLNTWAERAPPVSGAALTISCGAGAFVYVYSESRLFIGGTLSTQFHDLIATGINGTVRSAKFAPDDHLWIVTDQGVFRSTAALTSPP